jgi:biopolymer transport protein TolQ
LIAALLFQLPPDNGAGQGTPQLAQASSALVEMVMNSGPVAMLVLVLLLIASLYSWTVILGKISTFSKVTKESRKFLRGFRNATRLQEMVTLAASARTARWRQVFEEVYETYKRQTGGSGPTAQPGSAGALGADGSQRSGDQPGSGG